MILNPSDMPSDEARDERRETGFWTDGPGPRTLQELNDGTFWDKDEAWIRNRLDCLASHAIDVLKRNEVPVEWRFNVEKVRDSLRSYHATISLNRYGAIPEGTLEKLSEEGLDELDRPPHDYGYLEIAIMEDPVSPYPLIRLSLSHGGLHGWIVDRVLFRVHALGEIDKPLASMLKELEDYARPGRTGPL